MNCVISAKEQKLLSKPFNIWSQVGMLMILNRMCLAILIHCLQLLGLQHIAQLLFLPLPVQDDFDVKDNFGNVYELQRVNELLKDIEQVLGEMRYFYTDAMRLV
jgi:hypothetical protein